ncbi:MAG: hypothetical protein IJF37_10545 [Lachnospiraceae bacterium]|nr:hypothetical protein [Lachnospiraceae bacterium]
MKRTYRIEEVSLWLIFMTMAKQLKWLTIIVALEAVVLACVGAFTEAIYFSLIFFVGVIGSYSIHEYVHILLLRRNGVSQVNVGSSFLKFSIIPDKQLRGKELIIVAVSGPIVCGLIGGISAIIALLSGSLFLKILAMIYSFHLINLIPVFGDGKMFIKGLFT